VFDCYGHRLKYKDGRQQNYIDYSQYFIDNYPEINNCLLFDSMGKQNESYYYAKRFFDGSDIRNFKFDYKFKTINNFTTSDVLLCDFAVLLFLIQYDLPISGYNKIFLFDCLELTVFFRGTSIPVGLHSDFDINGKMKKFLYDNIDKITFLITPYNFDDVYGFDYIEYYKKINYSLFKDELVSQDRKDGLIYYTSDANDEFYGNKEFLDRLSEKYDDLIITNKYIDLFGYKNILYTAKPYVGFMEQFGRQVFEFRNFGYNVIVDQCFQVESKTGLDYYLKYNGSLDIIQDNLMDIVDENT